MVSCSCGKTIEKIPDWMAGITVQYVCNNCPNRQLKNIAFVNLDPGIPASSKAEAEEDVDVDDSDKED